MDIEAVGTAAVYTGIPIAGKQVVGDTVLAAADTDTVEDTVDSGTAVDMEIVVTDPLAVQIAGSERDRCLTC